MRPYNEWVMKPPIVKKVVEDKDSINYLNLMCTGCGMWFYVDPKKHVEGSLYWCQESPRCYPSHEQWR